MINIQKKIKIKWNDTLVFFPKRKGDTPLLKEEDLTPPCMETIGLLDSEHDDYFLIKEPRTINTKTRKKHPEKDATFYLIPKGMVESVDYID